MTDELVITVNGKQHVVESAPDTPLLYVLRNELTLNGPQFGCGLERCGSCKVLIGDQAVPSCQMAVSEATEKPITTLEGLSILPDLHPVQRAFIEQQAAQCGYCINGMIMTTVSLLQKNPHPTDEQTREALDNNLCRCGAHFRILSAVRRAEELLGSESQGAEK